MLIYGTMSNGSLRNVRSTMTPEWRYRAFKTEPTSPQVVTQVELERLYVYGLPPNLAQTDMPYDSLLPYLAGENAKALSRSLDATELDTSRTITTGHSHSEASYKTGLTWMQAGSWGVVNSQSITANYPALNVTTTSLTAYALVPFIVPSGLRYVVPRVFADCNNAATYLTVRVYFYVPSGLEGGTVVVDGGQISVNSTTAAWYEGGMSDLESATSTNSRKVVYMKLDAKVDSNSADIYGWQVGLRWGA
jgi:hypothetical protein